MDIDNFYKESEYCWVIIIQGKGGENKYNETSLDEIHKMIKNHKQIKGIVSGQSKRKTDIKMYNDKTVPRYIGINYKNKLNLYELNEFEPIELSDKLERNKGSILYNFTVKKRIGIFDDRMHMKEVLDKTNRSNAGILRLNKEGSKEYEKKREKLIIKYEKELNKFKN